MFDPSEIKKQFPLLMNQPNLIYLDNAATTQRAASVLETLDTYYRNQNANIHRGLYPLSAQSTQRYEAVRVQVAQFLGAPTADCIAFTSGTTEAINMVAQGYLKAQLQAGDNIVLTVMEHHANLIPWQIIAKECQVELRFIPVDEDGQLVLEKIPQLLDERTRLLGLTAISNSIGTVNPIAAIAAMARTQEIPILVDGAQSTGIYPIDLEALDVDFYTFSAHKLFGPFGVGALYVHPRRQAQMHPFRYGGGMIRRVQLQESTFLPYPRNQEGGTPNVAGVLGLGAAIEFCEQLNRAAAQQHVQDLGEYARVCLEELEGVNLIGQGHHSGGIVAFTMTEVHPHDVAQFLAEAGIAVRAGHHCTQPLLDFLEVPATVRVSFSIYNQRAEVQQLAKALEEIKAFWI